MLRGTPQGGVISPLLANLYLNPLDHQMAAAGWAMVRSADDFVILCRTQAEAQAALAAVTAWVNEAGLTLHPAKTRVVDATQADAFAHAIFPPWQQAPQPPSHGAVHAR